ncbi:Tol biopolymer transport system component/C-terminal processing protease CtpA/Prc [Caulobacter ginsengisoli]|uniref:Tricorn protease homolog n=1 Tax=Caulobacter ginsengisoli TaxID=400775 RepID=A0ABU0IP29_9CAUL|nr:S41 family peptidase [Caulobacter ginsengisoli]MDQ0463763.1 Tol biopolymer transport system component/C-terminal processing protease CtpA/Prc [Caulobacter ginsengisoli]
MSRMWLGLVGAVLLAGTAVSATPDSRPSLYDPSLSPDGSEIAFVSGGDIWTVPSQGGTARLLVTDPATEARPLYSPDGTQLAFQSTREGPSSIYILSLATGQIRRLTYSDAGESLDGWSRDGKWIYFTSGANDVARQNDIFRVSAAGGTPLEVSRERYLNEFESAPSPDGQSIALVAKGISSTQWWRNGHAHIDETELWLKPVATGAPYRRLLAADAKHAWPMWSADGGALYYMSDESGAENVWKLATAPGASPQQVTKFTDGRLLWPSIGLNGRSIVFERGFAIWKLDTATGQTAQVPITLLGAPAAARPQHRVETDLDSFALAPDGKKVTFAARGEIFAATTKEGGPGQRITRTVSAEGQAAWSPDSKRVVYVSEQGLDARLMLYNFQTSQETVLTTATGNDTAPIWSPDGKKIAYVHANRQLRVITLDAKGVPASDVALYDNPALVSDEGTPPVWSPDGQWLAFVVTDRKSFTNINVVPAAGGTPRPISFLANGQTGGLIAWSPDGKFILFSTSQRSEESRIVRIDLVPHVPKYREDSFRDLFKPSETPDKPAPDTKDPKRRGPTKPPVDKAGADKPADDAKAEADKPAAAADKPKKVEPVKIVFEGLRERVSVLPLGLSAGNPVISPDGKVVVFVATVAGQDNLYSYSLDELAKEPATPVQITSNAKPKTAYVFTADSKTLYYLEDGTIMSTGLEGPKPKALAVSAELDVDFDAEKQVVFDEAWGTLNRRFYDAKFHGKDWAALRAKWQPYIAGARTPDELRRDINLMIGELNASHSGINRGGPNLRSRVGLLGLRFDRDAFEAGKGLVVREVITLGPAFIEGSIKPGETLVAVNGQAVGPNSNLDALLLDQIGKRTVLKVAGAAGTREVVVRPISRGVEAGLNYRQWVGERRAYVEKISGGRLGYVHIADMGDDSLAQLYLDLDAQNQEKQGVVIDIRNNNGGYINGYALDVFTRRNYLMFTQRDQPFAVPTRQALGQRALGAPTVLLINESSLSDAEDFTEGYRALGLGKVVGVPTAGWIIFTTGQSLIDGSVVRVPMWKVEDLRGQNMELNPRPVDVKVERPLGETLTGDDAQLKAAVDTLLGQIGAR